jgi:hypothetical protein
VFYSGDLYKGEDMGKYKVFEHYFQQLCTDTQQEQYLTSYYDKKEAIIGLHYGVGLLQHTPKNSTNEEFERVSRHFTNQISNCTGQKNDTMLMIRVFDEILKDNYEVPSYSLYPGHDEDIAKMLSDDYDGPLNADSLSHEDRKKAFDLYNRQSLHIMTHLDSLWQFYRFVRPKKNIHGHST